MLAPEFALVLFRRIASTLCPSPIFWANDEIAKYLIGGYNSATATRMRWGMRDVNKRKIFSYFDDFPIGIMTLLARRFRIRSRPFDFFDSRRTILRHCPKVGCAG